MIFDELLKVLDWKITRIRRASGEMTLARRFNAGNADTPHNTSRQRRLNLVRGMRPQSSLTRRALFLASLFPCVETHG
jgi:hypothetical protein